MAPRGEGVEDAGGAGAVIHLAAEGTQGQRPGCHRHRRLGLQQADQLRRPLGLGQVELHRLVRAARAAGVAAAALAQEEGTKGIQPYRDQLLPARGRCHELAALDLDQRLEPLLTWGDAVPPHQLAEDLVSRLGHVPQSRNVHDLH